MQAYLVPKANQAYTIKALNNLMAAYGTAQAIKSDQGTHFTARWYYDGHKRTALNDDYICCIIQQE